MTIKFNYKMKNISLILIFLIISISVNAQKLKKVNFDNNFKKEHQGKSNVEINEVKELLHIMIAITDAGLGNDDMINQSTPYYQELLKHFKPFKDESIIIKFDSLIKANPLNYIFLTGNAISYDFKRNKLIKDKNYIFPAQSVSSHTTIKENPITTYKNELERFAEKSDFRKFYRNSKKYYDEVINDYNTQANIDKQWKWLENNFETKVNNYVIMCSPLIGGLNYTTSYEDNDFTQIFLVVPPISNLENLSDINKIITNTRPIFTEIDHNYIGKPTDKYEKIINEALKTREIWVKTDKYGTKYYPNPKKIFDEYMTWSIYILYIMDYFKDNKAAFDYAYNDINSVMIDRGFIKIKEFNDTLIELRKNNPNNKIEELYPELIEWCKTQ
ncbi:DUF4932 domain-containing protein [Algoriella sp.]|uniref:DUF4932 domain-containing protein n=2 Tax=Algoriella sp. TaxID=1872434 RepID=UPI002FCA3047